MNSLYIHSYQAVNKKDTTFKTSLILFSIEVYSLILNILGKCMHQYANFCYPKHFNKSEKWTYSFLISEYPLFEPIHVEKKHLAEKLDIGIRQLERHFKKIEDAKLIQRDYETIDTTDRKIGNCLILTITPQKTKAETMDNMTFFAEFEEIEEETHRFGTTKRARFKNVYNIAQTIYLSRTWLDLKPEDFNSRALAEIEEGEQVCFQTKVIKTEKGYYLKSIHNIRRSCEYYDNR